LSSPFSSSSSCVWCVVWYISMSSFFSYLSFFYRNIKYEGPSCLFMFFFYFCFCIFLLLLLINLSFILIIIYLCFFFSYFQFILIALSFGVIPSSKIDRCLMNTIGDSGGAHFEFYDGRSYFRCNGKDSGYFLKGLQLNCVIRFFFYIFFASYFYLVFTNMHICLKIFS
jgi:hypothetical protein